MGNKHSNQKAKTSCLAHSIVIDELHLPPSLSIPSCLKPLQDAQEQMENKQMHVGTLALGIKRRMKLL